MYYASQTLRHKETNDLVRLRMAEDDGIPSLWHWGNLKNGETLFVSEDGSVIKGHLKDYTHIEDELGRACGGIPDKDEYVATRYKKYLVPAKEMAILREKKLLEWEAMVLGEMEQSDEVRNPFADGSQSWVFEKWFLEKRGALSLHRSYDSIREKHHDEAYMDSRSQIFFHQGRFWVWMAHLSALAVSDTEHLKKVAALVQKEE